MSIKISMRRTVTLQRQALLLACLAISVVMVSAATETVFASGSVASAYADSSWCTPPRVTFSTVMKTSGGANAKVISFTPHDFCGVQLYRKNSAWLALKSFKYLTWVLNGGSMGGQTLLRAGVTIDGKRYYASLAAYLPQGSVPANRWLRINVPLTAFSGLDVASARLQSVFLQTTSQSSQRTLFVESVRFTSATTSTPTRRPTPRPTRSPTPVPGPSGTSRLQVRGNRIIGPDGEAVRLRGFNIMDMRSNTQCWPTDYDLSETVPEVKRRVTAAVGWGANFLRLMLENYDAEGADGLAAPGPYLDAIKGIAQYVGTTHPGVYLMITIWQDPTLTATQTATTEKGWPTEGTNRRWARLVPYFKGMEHVLFGVINEPEANYDGKLNPYCWEAMNTAVGAIRDAEIAAGDFQHLVAVQGTQVWARVLDYYVDHPIKAGGGANVIYETHMYDHEGMFNTRLAAAATRPVIIGEFGPAVIRGEAYQTLEESKKLMALAEARGIPWLAWSFSEQTPPGALLPGQYTDDPEREGDVPLGCHVGDAAIALEPNEWGQAVKDRLAKPWGSA